MCIDMLFYKRLLVAPRDASSAKESKVKGGERDVTEKDVHDGDGADGSGTDDDFMVYGHDDVVWTGMVIDFFYNT
jgi:hypothetical protein